MPISGISLTFLVGCLGGVMGEALNWYARRESPRLPQYLKGARYWITTIVMIIIGGILAVLYGIEEKSAILVANIGLTAPILIKALAQIPPQGANRALAGAPSIRDFIIGR